MLLKIATSVKIDLHPEWITFLKNECRPLVNDYFDYLSPGRCRKFLSANAVANGIRDVFYFSVQSLSTLTAAIALPYDHENLKKSLVAMLLHSLHPGYTHVKGARYIVNNA